MQQEDGNEIIFRFKAVAGILPKPQGEAIMVMIPAFCFSERSRQVDLATARINNR